MKDIIKEEQKENAPDLSRMKDEVVKCGNLLITGFDKFKALKEIYDIEQKKCVEYAKYVLNKINEEGCTQTEFEQEICLEHKEAKKKLEDECYKRFSPFIDAYAKEFMRISSHRDVLIGEFDKIKDQSLKELDEKGKNLVEALEKGEAETGGDSDKWRGDLYQITSNAAEVLRLTGEKIEALNVELNQARAAYSQKREEVEKEVYSKDKSILEIGRKYFIMSAVVTAIYENNKEIRDVKVKQLVEGIDLLFSNKDKIDEQKASIIQVCDTWKKACKEYNEVVATGVPVEQFDPNVVDGVDISGLIKDMHDMHILD